MADFSGGLFGGSNLGTYYGTDSSGAAQSSFDPSQLFDTYGSSSDSGVSSPGPGSGGLTSTQVGGDLGTAVGALIGGGLGSIVDMPGMGAAAGGGLGNLAGGYLGGLFGARGGRGARGTHLNKTTYYTKSGRVAKGTKLVANRRRNAGNAKAVRRALGRLAMFDNLARKVEGEMQRVARRHHRPARAVHHHRSGHKAGCKCFACRR